ncbi:hypothetical protein SAMN02983003_0134 [Devosia enhydra]|uniref:Uncharacterized protein n=1 Tax=Devosia enhydra TaxID=665118 RepID=A0A1K2HSG9_9HYPH|nr:hypothetical protein [Devosia enhydra]SFZ80790.1 hypothetical protein SAMN02983003_0134 [Devosia enhydra]
MIDLTPSNLSFMAVRISGHSNTAQDALTARIGEAPTTIRTKTMPAWEDLMTLSYINAERFRARFEGVPLFSTGSLRGDVEQLYGVLWHVHRELLGEEHPWSYLDVTDPIETIRRIAAHVELVNAELRLQGFRPPDVDFWADPLGLVEHNARFLASVRKVVAEPDRVLH